MNKFLHIIIGVFRKSARTPLLLLLLPTLLLFKFRLLELFTIQALFVFEEFGVVYLTSLDPMVYFTFIPQKGSDSKLFLFPYFYFILYIILHFFRF